MHFAGGMGIGMIWFWIIGLLFLGLIIWLVFRATDRNVRDYPGGKSSLDILKDRYARGEIEKEEFEQKKKDLLS